MTTIYDNKFKSASVQELVTLESGWFDIGACTVCACVSLCVLFLVGKHVVLPISRGILGFVLAIECVDNAMGCLCLIWKTVRKWYYATSVDVSLLSILEGDCNEELGEQLVEVSRPELVGEDREESTVKRRVRAGCKMPFKREIVAAVKAKFGTPKPTEANLRAVRRYATEVMREHNLRHTHVQKLLPSIIAAAFVPDKYELAGMEMASCVTALDRQSEYNLLKKTAGYSDC